VSEPGADHPFRHRLRRMREHALKNRSAVLRPPQADVALECGWGRLLFGQTFREPRDLIQAIRAEAPDCRDIAFYVPDPHVLIALAPQELFLDPSHTFRLEIDTYRPAERPFPGFKVRSPASPEEADGMALVWAARHMVPSPPEFVWSQRAEAEISYLLAADANDGRIIGAVMGVDHFAAFGDPERGSSLWCLAVDPQATHPGVGEALVRALAEHYQARGCAYMDLSVLHDNASAIALYEKLGFHRVPFFAVKRKNPINEKLFTGPSEEHGLNPYARLIVDEARRRGILAEVTDAEGGFFRLTHGGRSIHCRESLSELTSGVAVSICDDKAVTRRVVQRAGVVAPEQIEAGDVVALEAFLRRHGSVVVKPARGEQGRGVAVGLETVEEVERAVEFARSFSDRVLIEQQVVGDDLRLIIIDFRLVAAATRKPARVVGDGVSTIRSLIEVQSRRRAAATGGESKIPIDAETERCLSRAGFTLDSVPGQGEEVYVRKTANLHTGGTIHDVTDQVHPRLAEAAIAAARAIDIPVTGIDFMVRSPSEPEYAFIEANERPGLANHEPQPTAERFVDLLFPMSVPPPMRAGGEGR
jgi:GNAT-family acetyltransferase (TIGR03103 family)